MRVGKGEQSPAGRPAGDRRGAPNLRFMPTADDRNRYDGL